jgi:hypothetical protein
MSTTVNVLLEHARNGEALIEAFARNWCRVVILQRSDRRRRHRHDAPVSWPGRRAHRREQGEPDPGDGHMNSRFSTAAVPLRIYCEA